MKTFWSANVTREGDLETSCFLCMCSFMFLSLFLLLPVTHAHEGNPCFPIETCTLCHLLFNTQSENTNWLCFILPACPAFSRNGQDNIGSAATRDYSQSVIRDYCMALVLQTSACNLNLTRSHLAFICKITAQEMLSVISRSHSMWEIRPCCPLVTSLCWLVLEDFICCQQEYKLYLGYLKNRYAPIKVDTLCSVYAVVVWMLMLNVGKRRHIGVSVCTNNPCETRLWVSGRSKSLGSDRFFYSWLWMMSKRADISNVILSEAPPACAQNFCLWRAANQKTGYP